MDQRSSWACPRGPQRFYSRFAQAIIVKDHQLLQCSNEAAVPSVRSKPGWEARHVSAFEIHDSQAGTVQFESGGVVYIKSTQCGHFYWSATDEFPAYRDYWLAGVYLDGSGSCIAVLHVPGPRPFGLPYIPKRPANRPTMHAVDRTTFGKSLMAVAEKQIGKQPSWNYKIDLQLIVDGHVRVARTVATLNITPLKILVDWGDSVKQHLSGAFDCGYRLDEDPHSSSGVVLVKMVSTRPPPEYPSPVAALQTANLMAMQQQAMQHQQIMHQQQPQVVMQHGMVLAVPVMHAVAHATASMASGMPSHAMMMAHAGVESEAPLAASGSRTRSGSAAMDAASDGRHAAANNSQGMYVALAEDDVHAAGILANMAFTVVKAEEQQEVAVEHGQTTYVMSDEVHHAPGGSHDSIVYLTSMNEHDHMQAQHARHGMYGSITGHDGSAGQMHVMSDPNTHHVVLQQPDTARSVQGHDISAFGADKPRGDDQDHLRDRIRLGSLHDADYAKGSCCIEPIGSNQFSSGAVGLKHPKASDSSDPDAVLHASRDVTAAAQDQAGPALLQHHNKQARLGGDADMDGDSLLHTAPGKGSATTLDMKVQAGHSPFKDEVVSLSATNKVVGSPSVQLQQASSRVLTSAAQVQALIAAAEARGKATGNGGVGGVVVAPDGSIQTSHGYDDRLQQQQQGTPSTAASDRHAAKRSRREGSSQLSRLNIQVNRSGSNSMELQGNDQPGALRMEQQPSLPDAERMAHTTALYRMAVPPVEAGNAMYKPDSGLKQQIPVPPGGLYGELQRSNKSNLATHGRMNSVPLGGADANGHMQVERGDVVYSLSAPQLIMDPAAAASGPQLLMDSSCMTNTMIIRTGPTSIRASTGQLSNGMLQHGMMMSSGAYSGTHHNMRSMPGVSQRTQHGPGAMQTVFSTQQQVQVERISVEDTTTPGGAAAGPGGQAQPSPGGAGGGGGGGHVMGLAAAAANVHGISDLEQEVMPGVLAALKSMGAGARVAKQLWQRYRGHYSVSDEGRKELRLAYLELRTAQDFGDDDYMREVLTKEFQLEL